MGPIKMDQMDQKPSYEELEQRLAEFDKISKANQDLELIHNSVANAVIVLDPDQNILSVNTAAEKLMGLPEPDLLRRKCYEVMHGESCSTRPDVCPFKKIFSGEILDPMEAEIDLQKGNFLVSCTPVFNGNGQLDRVLHVSTNVTSLKKNEKKASMLLDATRTIPLSNSYIEAARSIYDICKDSIGATCGYVAMKSDDEMENDLLFLDDGGLPCFVDPSLPMPIRGLRKEAYDTGEVAYANDFMNSGYKEMMPDGHMDLNNVLFAPLKFGDDVAGVIGLANKKGGFKEHDIEVAKAFGEVAALALRHSTIKEDLVQKNKFSRNLLNRSPNPILVIDKKMSVTYVNKAFEKLSGYRLSEVQGLRPPYPWWTQDNLGKIQTDLDRAMKNGGVGVEEQFQKKTGETFYVEITSTPVFKDETLDYYLANWVDVTDRKMAQSELERSEKLHRATIENISDAVFITDDRNRFTYICPNTHLIFGFKPNEVAVLGSIEKLFKKQIFSAEELDEKREILNIPVEVLNKNGQTRFLLVNVKKVNIEKGSILYTCRDITEKKIVQDALKESQAVFLKAFQSAPVLITISRIEDGTYLEVNDTFVNSTGYNRDDAIGKTSVELGFIKKKDRDFLKETLQQRGFIRNAELELSSKDGAAMICLYSGEAIEINGVKKLLSTAIDITERKQQEDLLRQRQTELKAYSKKLEEMNTALNVLIDYRSEEKEGFKKDIIKNFEKLIFPYFPSSEKAKTREELSTILSIIERNIKEILLKGSNKNLSLYVGLTTMESQVAHMIKEGKSSKEIAECLNLSVRTVYFHRENIRKKLNLTKTHSSLKAHLQSQSR